MDINQPVSTIYGSHYERFKAEWERQVQALQAHFGSGITQVLMPKEYPTDVPVVFVSLDRWVEVLTFLKTEIGFQYGFLADYTATDEMPEEPRFHLVVNLFSHSSKCRIRVKVQVSEEQKAPTLIPVWTGANWAEREIFDMFGIKFEGHPDLRRNILDSRWEGHPLRKDYPLKGYQLFQTAEPIETKVLE